LTSEFWGQSVTTPLLCERYRLLVDRRRAQGELERLEARIASRAPALARQLERRRETLAAALSPTPNQASVDALQRDVQRLYALLCEAARRWEALGCP
jgi:hypothetical protein